MTSPPDRYESAARFLLAARWRPDPLITGSVLHADQLPKQVAVPVWHHMTLLLEEPGMKDPSN
jgi:hypothetical protein